MRNFRPGRLARSVELFYEAAVQPARWRDALHEFSQHAGAEGAILHANPPDGSMLFINSEALDAAFPQFLREGWHLENETLRRAITFVGAPVLKEATLFAPGEYLRDPMHMEFLRPNGFGWFAGLRALQSPEGTLQVSLQRSWRCEPFTRSEVAVLTRLVPHLRRVGRLALLTGAARAEGVLDGFSLLRVPAFLVGQGGAVSRVNDRAARLLGHGLDVARGRLVAPTASVSRALHRLASSLAADVPVWEADLPGPILVPRPSGRGVLVHGAPLPRAVRDIFGMARAVLVAVDLDVGVGREMRHLAMVCGLTRAEAETAAALADGLDFRAIAARRDVGLETVRSQAKSVGDKTGATSRGALVALLNRIVAHVLDAG